VKKIIEDKKQGEKLQEQIFSMPRPMAARLIINRKTHTLGQDLRDFVRESVAIKREAAEKKRLQGIETYKKDKSEYDTAIEKNKDKSCLMAWTVNDLKAVVKMETNKEDGPMPNTKKAIVELYAKCMERKGEKVVINTPQHQLFCQRTYKNNFIDIEAMMKKKKKRKLNEKLNAQTKKPRAPRSVKRHHNQVQCEDGTLQNATFEDSNWYAVYINNPPTCNQLLKNSKIDFVFLILNF
jgi:hypothetical protein